MNEFPITIPGECGATLSRFWGRVDTSGDCWLWKGALSRGYGYFYHGGKSQPAHRWLFARVNGPLRDGTHVDHVCRVRHCVRPGHLREVSRSENNQNLPQRRANNRSGYRGVYLHAKSGKWGASVRKDGASHFLGLHPTAESAAVVASAARRELFTHSEMDRTPG